MRLVTKAEIDKRQAVSEKRSVMSIWLVRDVQIYLRDENIGRGRQKSSMY